MKLARGQFIKADPDRVRELARQGHSQSMIATILDVSRERIRQICERDKIKTLSGRMKYDGIDKLKALAGTSMTAESAAKLAGYSTGNVFRQHGLIPPKRRTNIDRYRECAEAGMTLTETAAHCGKSVQNVFNECKRTGVMFTTKFRRSDQ